MFKADLIPPLFKEVPIPSQESERTCICEIVVSILPLSAILIFDFGIVPTVWYFLFFILLRESSQVMDCIRIEVRHLLMLINK